MGPVGFPSVCIGQYVTSGKRSIAAETSSAGEDHFRRRDAKLAGPGYLWHLRRSQFSVRRFFCRQAGISCEPAALVGGLVSIHSLEAAAEQLGQLFSGLWRFGPASRFK